MEYDIYLFNLFDQNFTNEAYTIAHNSSGKNIYFKIYKCIIIIIIKIAIIIIIIIWFGDTVTVSHSTKCDTNSKLRALS